MNIAGDRMGRQFLAKAKESTAKSGVCGTCRGSTHRTRYGILHKDCFGCRYLKMIFGPNIRVERTT